MARYRLAVAVLLVGLIVTAAAVIASHATYRNNEDRLLRLRAKEVTSVLTAAVPGVSTPLFAAAAIADTTGRASAFAGFARGYVGRGPARPFVSMALLRRAQPDAKPLVALGAAPVVLGQPARARAFLARAAARPTLNVMGLLNAAEPRIAYAFSGSPASRFLIYAESSLPRSRRSPIQQNAAFSDLDFALYLGRRADPAGLLLTSVAHPPLHGHTATMTVPFGTSSLLVVVAGRRPLSGGLAQALPLIAALLGIVLTLAATLISLRLVAGRRRAELVAAQQRGIASTLQHALLPDALPQIDGLEVCARYKPSEAGVEVGGDWYDLIPIGAERLLLVVGDVSGKGLRAAATMASMRFSIRAYVSQGDEPREILAKLARVVSVQQDGAFATVLCVVIDVTGRTIEVTSAGHLPPLLVAAGGNRFVEGKVGVPVGVAPDARYETTTVAAPAGASLVAYTDGLVERRGESIDAGLERLRVAATPNGSLDGLLDELLNALGAATADDDTAIAGIRWRT